MRAKGTHLAGEFCHVRSHVCRVVGAVASFPWAGRAGISWVVVEGCGTMQSGRDAALRANENDNASSPTGAAVTETSAAGVQRAPRSGTLIAIVEDDDM